MGLFDQLDLSSLKGALKNMSLGGSNSGSALGIDIGSSAIKVVQLKNEKGSAVLETYGELALGPYAGLDIGRATLLEVDKLAEALKEILKEANVSTKRCGVSIPFASSLITLLELPKVDSKVLKTMIPLEARKYIPVPIAEVELDWFVVPEGDLKYLSKEQVVEAEKQNSADSANLITERIQVLLVAIHKDVLRKYTTVFKIVGLEPAFYELEIFSSIRAAMGRTVAPTVVLDIGAAHSKVYIVEAGIVRATHVIQKGSQDITISFAATSGISVTHAEEMKRENGLLGKDEQGRALERAATSVMEHIFAGVERSILAYQRRFQTSLNSVILTGGGATLKGLLPLAQKKFEREVTIADPFKKVGAPAFLEGVLAQAGPEFAVGVGLALRKLQE